MKIVTLIISIIFSTLALSGQKSILGKWDTGVDNTIVEIKMVGDEIQGLVLSSSNAKAATGKVILDDIKQVKDKFQGKLYVTKKDRWVDTEMIPSDGMLSIIISAGWQKKTLEWKRKD